MTFVPGFGFGLAGPAFAGDCARIQRGVAAYWDCSFDPASVSIRVFSKGPDGEPFRSFSRLARQLWSERSLLVFAANGGMYDARYDAVGLFIEHGIERRPINRRTGWGNFHLLPNGVFYLLGKAAGVMETSAFVGAGVKPDYATQSGPMLVIDGAIHPRFKPDSNSWKRRNGVGVDRAGKVHFVISEAPVRFIDLALLFRDDLGCPNALYLDGTISSHYSPVDGRNDRLFDLGPIIGVMVPIGVR